jgi:arsenate reductase
MNVEVLVTADCPHAKRAITRVRDVVDALVPGTTVHEVLVKAEQDAQRLAMPGSPTVRVDGRDVDPSGGEPAFACRVYPNGEGMPDRWRIEAAMIRALRPRHFLFLCVANSARSQLAEGIARSLAPAGVTVSSAGSEPAKVRPQAIKVLEEIGLDISGHRTKSVNDVDASSVEAVITLCAEEVCPVFLGKAYRAHWGLPDPAGVQGDEGTVLDAFRATRDELRRRISVLFEGWDA